MESTGLQLSSILFYPLACYYDDRTAIDHRAMIDWSYVNDKNEGEVDDASDHRADYSMTITCLTNCALTIHCLYTYIIFYSFI